MTTLESMIAVAGEAPLADSLDFSLPPASTSVVDRRQHVRAYPTSASTLTPTTTRTVRIRLGGDEFINPASVRIQYTIVNGSGTNPLVPLTGPWGMWGQVYERSGGVEISNIPTYGRFHQQYGWNQLSMAEQYGEAGLCGMGGNWGNGSSNVPLMGEIPAGQSYTVMHRLYTTLLSTSKLLPTRYMPLEYECSLSSTPADWLNTAGGNSQTFSIQNIQLLYDAYILDESVLESFYKSLLSNRVLSIPCMVVYQIQQSIPAGSTSFSFSAVRAFSRLSHVWLTFQGTGAKSSQFLCPTSIVADNTGSQPDLTDQAPGARLSIGPKFYPDPAPATTIPELFYMFQKALPGVPNMDRDDYLRTAFTIAFDVRRMPSDPSSSISTRSGDLLRIDLTNLTANVASTCWLTLFAFGVTACRETGVTLLT
mgnify:CR=1 FL=1